MFFSKRNKYITSHQKLTKKSYVWLYYPLVEIPPQEFHDTKNDGANRGTFWKDKNCLVFMLNLRGTYWD